MNPWSNDGILLRLRPKSLLPRLCDEARYVKQKNNWTCLSPIFLSESNHQVYQELFPRKDIYYVVSTSFQEYLKWLPQYMQ